MNSQELYNITATSIACSHPTGYRDALRSYIQCHCTNPKKIFGFNPYTGKREQIEVPCGKCYHCRETRTNEWVTRLYAHAEDFKNVYFITLTYRSFERNLSKLDSYLIDYLRDAFWHLDNNNKNDHYCYSPCLLCKNHYQNFLKRLRKNTGLNDITYILCGEYGSQFHRPHFHAILFTNGTLKYEDIVKAWALELSKVDGSFVPARNNKSSVLCRFGRVDFHSLRENGSFDTMANVDGKMLDSHKCFAYVCKYINKDEYNAKRVGLAYNDIFYNNNSYDLQNFEEMQVNNLLLESYPKDFREFKFKFRPFVSPSRGTPIASLFVARHVQEMARGVFSHSSLQTKSIVTPSYFVRKAQEYVYGLRKISDNGSCFGKGNLLLLSSYLSQMVRGDVSLVNSVDSERAIDIQQVLNTNKCFKDLSTGLRYIIFKADLDYSFVNGYKYDRSLRKFVQVSSSSVEDFATYWVYRLDADFIRAYKSFRLREKNRSFFDEFISLYENEIPHDEEFDSYFNSLMLDEDLRIKSYFDYRNINKKLFE